MKLSVVQINSGNSVETNLNKTSNLVSVCMESDQPEMIALPEFFSFLSADGSELREAGQELSKTIPGFLSSLAEKNKVAIHAGSSIIEEDGNLYNQSFAFDNKGNLVATYRKIHLFDINLPGGGKIFESDIISRGEKLSTYQVENLTVGCSICFDIRYPELYAKLINKGAEVLMIPAAFTFQTGADHWEILLRARAIETQSYVVAPAQVFSYADGKYSNWGHSMIIDPWGTVIAQVSEEEGFATAQLSKLFLEKVRARIPVQTNRYWK